MNELKLKLEFDDIEPVCTNEMYRPTVSAANSSGKRHAFLRSSYELMEFQDKFDKMLSNHKTEIDLFINNCKKLYKYLGFKVFILLRIPKDIIFYKRKSDDLRPCDASNYIKAIEDRLSVIIGIDDKYNMEVRSVKYCSEISNWGFSIIVEPVNYFDYNNDKYKEDFSND